MSRPQVSPSRKIGPYTVVLDPHAEADLDGLFATVADGQDPSHWPGLEKIKESTVRTIYRGHSNGLDFHLKLFRAVRLSDRARDAIRGTRAMREFDNLQAAAGRDIPVVQALAAGRYDGSGGSRSFLLTRTEPGASLPRTGWSAEQAQVVGELLRSAHDHGLHARDLHPGNVLERPDGSMRLMDLTSAALANPLEEEERARALAFFCLDLDGLAHDPVAAPLMQAYGADRTMVEEALRLGRRLRTRALASFGRRAFRNCRHTKVEKGRRRPTWSLHVPMQEHWHAARHIAEQTDVRHELQAIKVGRRGGVFEAEGMIVKLRDAAAARRLLQSAYWLQFASVPCAEPVALWTHDRQGLYFSSRIPNRNLLEELATGLPHPTLTACAANLGTAIGRLHGFGLRNRDLKLDNLVRLPDNQVAMVDLDGVRRRPPQDGRRQAADLGRLLAAFRAAGEPGGDSTWRVFLRTYLRTVRRLQHHVVLRQLCRTAQSRAAAWASAHPQ